mgnify:CR=1 FL=1
MKGIFQGEAIKVSEIEEFDIAMTRIIEMAMKKKFGTRLISIILINKAMDLLSGSSISFATIMHVVLKTLLSQVMIKVPKKYVGDELLIDYEEIDDECDDLLKDYYDNETKH